MSVPNRSFLFRHKLISALRDPDIRGIRRLSVLLPKLLLPSPGKVGKHVLKTIHGVELLIDPSIDKGGELSLFETGTYEKGTIQLLHQFLKPGSTFLDIGANIGLMSSIASKQVGEKVRCMLSRMMLAKANFLMMDEPTNHLDLESITALNNGMSAFEGTMLFTSHDHELVSTVANRIIELTPNGFIDKMMPYDDYLADAKIATLQEELYA